MDTKTKTGWACPSCTLSNENANTACSACRTTRPSFTMDPNGTSAEARAAVERGKSRNQIVNAAIATLTALPFNTPPKSTPTARTTLTVVNTDGSQQLCCLYAVMYCLGVTMTAPNAFLYARAMLAVTDAIIGYFGCKGAGGKTVLYGPKKEEFDGLRKGITTSPVDLEDLINHKGALERVIKNASTGLDHALTCFLTCIMFTNIPLAFLCAATLHDGTYRLDAFATTSPRDRPRNRAILGNLIFIPSGSDLKGYASGHYWALRPGWGYNDHHAACILSRLLYIFSLSTGDTPRSPGGPQQVLRKALHYSAALCAIAKAVEGCTFSFFHLIFVMLWWGSGGAPKRE